MSEPQLCHDCLGEAAISRKQNAAPRLPAPAAVIAHRVHANGKTEDEGIPLCLYHLSVQERMLGKMHMTKCWTVEAIPASKP